MRFSSRRRSRKAGQKISAIRAPPSTETRRAARSSPGGSLLRSTEGGGAEMPLKRVRGAGLRPPHTHVLQLRSEAGELQRGATCGAARPKAPPPVAAPNSRTFGGAVHTAHSSPPRPVSARAALTGEAEAEPLSPSRIPRPPPPQAVSRAENASSCRAAQLLAKLTLSALHPGGAPKKSPLSPQNGKKAANPGPPPLL